MSDPTPSEPTLAEPWYRMAFGAEYLDLYVHRNHAEAATAVASLAAQVNLDPDHDVVLDLCCGSGRHLRYLGGLSRESVGLDLSEDLLHNAQAIWRESWENDSHLPGIPHGLPTAQPPLVQADMRAIPFADHTFDVVFNLFTSFGYFENAEDNQRVLREIARVLKSSEGRNGQLVLDHINRDFLLETLQPRSERTLPGGAHVLERREWLAGGSTVVKHVTLTGSDGRKQRWHESVRVYEPDELEALLEESGLRPVRRLGDYDGAAWSAQSPRMIQIAEKY